MRATTAKGLLIVASMIGLSYLIGDTLLGDSSETPPAPVPIIGGRVVLTREALACPSLDDLNKVIVDKVHNDSVGFDRDFAAAGCFAAHEGDAGLTLDYSVWHGIAELRLDNQPFAPVWVSVSPGWLIPEKPPA